MRKFLLTKFLELCFFLKLDFVFWSPGFSLLPPSFLLLAVWVRYWHICNRSVVTVCVSFRLAHICAAVSRHYTCSDTVSYPPFSGTSVFPLPATCAKWVFWVFSTFQLPEGFSPDLLVFLRISILWGFSEYDVIFLRAEGAVRQGAMGHPLLCSRISCLVNLRNYVPPSWPYSATLTQPCVLIWQAETKNQKGKILGTTCIICLVVQRHN